MTTSIVVTGKLRSVLFVAGFAILSARRGGGSGTGVALPNDPSIGLSETSKSFSATAGSGDPAPQTVAITNVGDGTLTEGTYTASVAVTSATTLP